MPLLVDLMLPKMPVEAPTTQMPTALTTNKETEQGYGWSCKNENKKMRINLAAEDHEE